MKAVHVHADRTETAVDGVELVEIADRLCAAAGEDPDEIVDLSSEVKGPRRLLYLNAAMQEHWKSLTG